MNKKSQAAMEFLITYGWAILAAIIAIGVLAYFGVFSSVNENCLKIYAVKYCESNNMTFSDVTGVTPSFQCKIENDESLQRTLGRDYELKTYYFLKSEIEECKK